MFEARFIVGSESLLKGTLKSEKKKMKTKYRFPGPIFFALLFFN